MELSLEDKINYIYNRLKQEEERDRECERAYKKSIEGYKKWCDKAGYKFCATLDEFCKHD